MCMCVCVCVRGREGGREGGRGGREVESVVSVNQCVSMCNSNNYVCVLLEETVTAY